MALQHTRSRSFPCGSQEAAIIKVGESLLSESTPSSLSSVSNRIKGLQNLYGSIDDLLLLPHIQRSIAHECSEKCVDEMMEGYIMLLDACAAAKDVVSLAKRDAQELLSGVRRRMHAEAASTYLSSRRKLRKMVQKASFTMRKKQNLGKGYETRPVEKLLMDAKSATLGMISSLFFYMTGTKTHSSGSLVAKIMESKKVEETDFSKVDAALMSFMQNGDDDVKFDDVLKSMECSIQIVEDGLECLFRRLIKTRVVLLNILSH
ncbi:hypothetical protein AAHA92_25445 [Salvia divinorum]|uniref:Uncharacterized protein n=1 Tax=Salvia divinorum TaxID=28513 RepID=A0ABD1GAQ9_SALDI